MRSVLIGVGMALWLAACGQQKPSHPPLPKTPGEARLFDRQRDELQRAKAVEQTLQQQSQAQRQAIEQQSR
ncbi:MAG TPA: hypothetical protein VMV97_12745 [Sulfuriferula sp.]|nr:hypothetical protein [Sulfuriferula sp.]